MDEAAEASAAMLRDCNALWRSWKRFVSHSLATAAGSNHGIGRAAQAHSLAGFLALDHVTRAAGSVEEAQVTSKSFKRGYLQSPV